MQNEQDFYRALAGRMADSLKPGGYMVLELGIGQAAAVENARRQALAAANDLIRVYSMLDIKLNRGLLDNIMLLGLHHAVEPLEAGAERENWEIP